MEEGKAEEIQSQLKWDEGVEDGTSKKVVIKSFNLNILSVSQFYELVTKFNETGILTQFSQISK